LLDVDVVDALVSLLAPESFAVVVVADSLVDFDVDSPPRPFDADLESVTYQPVPLKTMPTG
jgi:hypothetical protein